MPAAVIPWFRQQFLDSNGDPLSSGTLEFTDSGTSTPRAVFSDSDLSVSAGTTVTLNVGGFPTVSGVEVALYLSPVAYRVVLKNAAGTTVRTVDNVYAVQTASSVNLDIADAVAGEALSANDLAYLSDGSGGLTAGRWYKADADLSYGAGAPILGFATAAIASGATGTIRIGGVMTGFAGLSAGSTYYASATAGAITATAPTSGYVRSVGVAASATTITIDVAPRSGDLPLSPHGICEGRLTLTTAVPVTVADVTAATTLRYAPYTGNRIALYDGAASWRVRSFAELSIAVPATTSQMYDVFVYDNAGTPTLELTAWTNDTTRATALTRQDGVLVKTGATTRRYVGSCRTTGVSGQTEDSFVKRYVWNYYHRVPRVLRVTEGTDSWTYTTATFRQANGNAANQLDVVIGVAEVMLSATLLTVSGNTNADVERFIGIGEDSTTTPMANQLHPRTASPLAATVILAQTAEIRHYPAVGRHTYVWLEYSGAGVGTTTWYGDRGDTSQQQSGLVGSVEG